MVRIRVTTNTVVYKQNCCFRLVVLKSWKSIYACARFLVSFVFAVDSKIQIPQSTASVRQSLSKFKPFSGWDGTLKPQCTKNSC